MYQCSVQISTIGLDDKYISTLKDIEPLKAFSHSFETYTEPGDFDPSCAARNSLVIADLRKTSIDDLKKISEGLPDSANLIVMAESDNTTEIIESVERVDDIWQTPLSDEELAYRFGQWQKARKVKSDLWEKDQFLEATINSIPSLVWYKTADGIHEKVNDSFCEIVNKPKDVVQGKGHAFIWDVEADDPACIESEERVMSTGETNISEEQVQTGEGTKLLTTYKSPLYNIDGTVMGTVGVGIDITQEREYEESLIEKNQTLETMFMSMECGILTHTLDGKQIVGINQAALDILGYATLEELLADGFDMMAASVVDGDKELLHERMAMLNEVGDSVSYEYRVLHKDGGIVHVVGSMKLIEQDGEVLCQRYLIDATDQKALEERKEIRHKGLIQALSSDYLVVCSFNIDTGDGETLRVTKSGHLNFEEIFHDDIALEKTILEYASKRVCDEDREYFIKALSKDNILKMLEKQNRLSISYRAKGKGGTQYREATIVNVGILDDGHYIVLGLRNVDKQTREDMEQKALLEKALAQANRASEAKSAFLTNMSHDIRTPMNAIIGFTTLAEKHLDQSDLIKDYLSKIQISSTHLLNLINDILDMSRIESGKVSLDEESCDLPELLKNTASLLYSEAENKKIEFKVDTSGIKDPHVICDKLKIDQIVLNLLGNSLKFTKPGGKIILSASQIDDKGKMPSVKTHANYRISVKDTGVGMDKEFVQHVFDPFERERTSTKSGIQGTGLGMTITKSLVNMMNGSISVESEKGVGTEFTIDLRLKLADISDDQKAAMLGSSASDKSKFEDCRILLVEDNALNREIAITLLEDEGFIVEAAEDGSIAIDRLRDVDADYYKLILMDIQMPVLNGYETTTIIRNFDDKKKANIPIIALTADAFEEDRQKALKCGMSGHLSKPIEVDKLLKTLESII